MALALSQMRDACAALLSLVGQSGAAAVVQPNIANIRDNVTANLGGPAFNNMAQLSNWIETTYAGYVGAPYDPGGGGGTGGGGGE